MKETISFVIFAKSFEEEQAVLGEISILNQSDVDQMYQLRWFGIHVIDAPGCFSKINVRGTMESYEIFGKDDRYHVELLH